VGGSGSAWVEPAPNAVCVGRKAGGECAVALTVTQLAGQVPAHGDHFAAVHQWSINGDVRAKRPIRAMTME